MSEQEPVTPIEKHTPDVPFAEAPYSGNVRVKIRGYDWQLTIRSVTFTSFSQKINGLMDWLDQNPQPAAPSAPAPVGAPVPPPAPAQPNVSGPLTAQCVMIEIGTSYTGNKPQLKFACNGLEHPLTYTKDVNEMAKLLAPIGFTVAHIVVGQKYPVNCIVTYQPNTKDGKTYNNVIGVRPA